MLLRHALYGKTSESLREDDNRHPSPSYHPSTLRKSSFLFHEGPTERINNDILRKLVGEPISRAACKKLDGDLTINVDFEFSLERTRFHKRDMAEVSLLWNAELTTFYTMFTAISGFENTHPGCVLGVITETFRAFRGILHGKLIRKNHLGNDFFVSFLYGLCHLIRSCTYYSFQKQAHERSLENVVNIKIVATESTD